MRDPLSRTRIVVDREVREPTLLALGLILTGVAVLSGACALGMAFLPAWCHPEWAFVAVAAVLAGLVLRFRRPGKPDPLPLTGRQTWFRRLLGWGRLWLIGLVACWLGLIAWSAVCPGGLAPAPKADPSLIRVVTWNIHCGSDAGLPWQQFDWPVRKHALKAALDQAQPDILCVQEATPDQVAFLEEALPGHHRVGIGRDGAAGGEHCAIYFNRQRFREIDGGTFWLEEPIDQPRPGGALSVKRICTWVRLEEVGGSRRTFRVYNTHFPLTEGPRRTGAQIILDQIAAGDPTEPVVLTGDFNAPPSAPSRRRLLDAGLADSAERAGTPVGKATFHMYYGIGFQCLDGILVDRRWRVHNHRILDVKPGNTFPSDHFALLADLGLPEPASDRSKGPGP